MKPYPAYKDSGIEWIGEIPEHWKALSLRFCLTILTDYTSNGSFASLAENVKYLESGFSRLVRLTDLRKNLENKGIYVNKKAHLFLKKSELFGGELLIANVGAYSGLVKLMPKLDGKFTLAPNMFLIRVNQNTRYFYYQLNASHCAEQLKLMAISSAQPKLNKENIRQLQVLAPPTNEQTQIANYLEKKTAQIDSLIAKKESLIKLLEEEKTALINQAVTKGLDPNVKMKDSGIEWLGEIPEHWEVWKISHAFKEIGSGTTPESGNPKYHKNGTINWLNTGDLNNGVLFDSAKKITDKAMEDYSSLKKYSKGSLVIAMYGATIGKTAIIDFETTTNQACCVFGKSEIISIDFLHYWFKANKEHIINLSIGGGQPNISQQILKGIRLGSPDLHEQNKICNFLDAEIEKMQLIANKAIKEIELLKEYKTTLISEVVTGKIDVRDKV